MKFGVFVSEYRLTVDTLDRLSTEDTGIILVGNGVYHAAVKDGGQTSPVLEKASKLFVLQEDLETRGYVADNIDSRVKMVNYGDVVDMIFNDFDKVAWL